MQFLDKFMDKTFKDIEIVLSVSLRGFHWKEFSQKKSAFKMFILKFTKHAIFYPKSKQWRLGILIDVSTLWL